MKNVIINNYIFRKNVNTNLHVGFKFEAFKFGHFKHHRRPQGILPCKKNLVSFPALQ